MFPRGNREKPILNYRLAAAEVAIVRLLKLTNASGVAATAEILQQDSIV
jgi:hypothetical protein